MHWTGISTPVGELTLVTDGEALTRVVFGSHVPPRSVRDDDHPVLRQAARELGEYFAGERREFDVPIAPSGSDFERAAWDAILRIPYGTTATDAGIAAEAGQPRAARAIGLVNSQNPLPIIIPGHRVVGVNGSMTGYGAGLDVKRWLLELEAAVVVARRKAA